MVGIPPESLIRNAHALVAILGHWPNFHDAEVCSIRLIRTGVCIEADIYVFSVSASLDQRGYYKRLNECLVTLRFKGVQDLQLEGFNHQNVLSSLYIEREERLTVTFESVFGMASHFSCSEIELVRVVPYKGELLTDVSGTARSE
jgi:hypothetical protein